MTLNFPLACVPLAWVEALVVAIDPEAIDVPDLSCIWLMHLGTDFVICLSPLLPFKSFLSLTCLFALEFNVICFVVTWLLFLPFFFFFFSFAFFTFLGFVCGCKVVYGCAIRLFGCKLVLSLLFNLDMVSLTLTLGV